MFVTIPGSHLSSKFLGHHGELSDTSKGFEGIIFKLIYYTRAFLNESTRSVQLKTQQRSETAVCKALSVFLSTAHCDDSRSRSQVSNDFQRHPFSPDIGCGSTGLEPALRMRGIFRNVWPHQSQRPLKSCRNVTRRKSLDITVYAAKISTKPCLPMVDSFFCS